MTATPSEYEGALMKPTLSLKLVMGRQEPKLLKVEDLPSAAKVPNPPATSILKQYHKQSGLLKPASAMKAKALNTL